MGGNQSAEADDADDRIRLDRILDPACCVRANMPARPAPTWLQPKRPWTVDLEGFKGGRRWDGDEESATSGAKRSPRTHARTQDANLRSIIVNNYLVAPREAAAAPGAGNPATSLFCPETFSGCESVEPEFDRAASLLSWRSIHCTPRNHQPIPQPAASEEQEGAAPRTGSHTWRGPGFARAAGASPPAMARPAPVPTFYSGAAEGKRSAPSGDGRALRNMIEREGRLRHPRASGAFEGGEVERAHARGHAERARYADAHVDGRCGVQGGVEAPHGHASEQLSARERRLSDDVALGPAVSGLMSNASKAPETEARPTKSAHKEKEAQGGVSSEQSLAQAQVQEEHLRAQSLPRRKGGEGKGEKVKGGEREGVNVKVGEREGGKVKGREREGGKATETVTNVQRRPCIEVKSTLAFSAQGKQQAVCLM